MIELEFEEGGALCQILDRVFSGLLPHENIDRKYVMPILDQLFSYIRLEEFRLEYFVLASILADYRSISFVDPDFVPTLDRFDLEHYLQAEIFDLVINPVVGMESFLLAQGLATNLEVEVNKENAAHRLFERVMEKYDALMDLKVPSEQSLSSVATLKEVFVGQAYRNMIVVLDTIQNKGKRFGKKLYRGASGCHEYSKDLAMEIDARINDRGSEVFSVTADNEPMIWQEMQEGFKKLFDSHLEPFDKALGVLINRLLVFVGGEGSGKTANLTTLAGLAATMDIGSALIITESTRSQVYLRVLTNYIYFKHKKKITTQHLTGNAFMPPEMARLARVASRELASKEVVHMIKAPEYGKVYETFKSVYLSTGAQLYGIDHSGELEKTTGKESVDIGIMTSQLIEFKRDFPVTVVVNSHESTLARELMNKGKKVGTGSTRGSVKLSQGADDVFVIYNNEEYKAKDIRMFHVTKSRGGPEGLSFMMRMNRSISNFEYSPELQQLLEDNAIEKEQLLKELVDKYKDEFPDDYDPDQRDFELGDVDREEGYLDEELLDLETDI